MDGKRFFFSSLHPAHQIAFYQLVPVVIAAYNVSCHGPVWCYELDSLIAFGYDTCH
ncbi:MAG: hypothetical protein Q9P14_10915 [candidate division KSB1 bacterium]|nr:hypothetical protein [candidate division KSB1 bacterium]